MVTVDAAPQPELAVSSESLATAGASGGSSVVPVLTLVVSGASVNAALGSGSGVVLSGDLRIEAGSAITRTLDASANDAAGTSVAAGGAFVISVLNDSANARLRRSARARCVTIRAASVSQMTGRSEAGANGAPPEETGDGAGDDEDGDPDGEADHLADKNIESAGKLAGQSNTSNVNAGAVSSLSANRQKAQTSEGSVSVAAGFALNIMNNSAVAAIDDGLAIEAREDGTEDSGAAVIHSINKTDAELSANASATNSTTGVGVAVAINIITYENIAEMGASSLKARTLSLAALLPGEEPEEEGEEAEAPEEEDNSFTAKITQLVTEYVADAIEDLACALNLGDLYSGAGLDEILADIVSEVAAAVIAELVSGTGLEGLFEGDLEEKLNEKLGYIEGLPASAFADAKAAILAELTGRLDSLLDGEELEPVALSGLSGELKAAAQDVVTELTEGLVNIDELRGLLKEDIVAFVKDKITAVAEAALEQRRRRRRMPR